MELRGVTTANVVEYFTIADCPALVSEGQLALFGKPFSGILRKDTVVRGVDGVYEGDIVVDSITGEELGIVVFAKGFKLHRNGEALKEFPKMEHIEVKEGNKESMRIATTEQRRTPLYFKYEDLCIGLLSFVTKVGNSIAIVERMDLVNPEKLSFVTGYTDSEGVAIAFGDEIEGCVVCLHEFDVCLRDKQGNYIQMEKVIKEEKE